MQNLVSRVAGVNNEELTMRGIGMGAALGHTVKSIAYQFKSNDTNGNSGIANNILSTSKKVTNMGTTNMKTSSLNTNTINKANDNNLKNENLNNKIMNNKFKTGVSRAYNVSKDVLKLGRYVADGTKVNDNFTNRNFNKYNLKNEKAKVNKNDENEISRTHSIFNTIKEDDLN